MHRTEADNNTEIGGLKFYTDGPPGTTLIADDRNTLQEELAYVIEQAGLTLKTAATETDTQLKEAIDVMVAAGPNNAAVDFATKNLIIDVQSNTTCDADADEVMLINGNNTPAYKSSLNETFDITTDLMAGTAEKASHWYQLWISVAATDGAVTRMMVPDLTGSDDGADNSKLIDSTADFITDKVSVGDIVYNITDNTKATITAIDNLTTLSLSSAIMANGENYVIHALSPTGLSAYKAHIGAIYNDSGSNLDLSYQIDKTVFLTTPVAVITGGVAVAYTQLATGSAAPITAKSCLSYIRSADAANATAITYIAVNTSGDAELQLRANAAAGAVGTWDFFVEIYLKHPGTFAYKVHVNDTTNITVYGYKL